MAKRVLRLLVVIVVSVVMLAGCGSGEEEPEKTADLVFSDLKAECSSRDGFFGGRYATFTVTGSVTNKSGNTVNWKDMPKLVTGGDDGVEIVPVLSEVRLPDGETCDITYEHEFDITHDELPTLSYSCTHSVDGFDSMVDKLNTYLGNVAETYAMRDAEREAERKAEEEKRKQEEKAAEEKRKQEEKAAEEKRQQEEKAAEEAKKAVEACNGKTADEGLKAAKDANYTAHFVDEVLTDVTSDVEDTDNGSDVHKARITDVEISEFLGINSVTFTLDYVDPAAKKLREEEEAKKAEEARKKEEADKVLTVDNCEDLAKLLDLADQGDAFISDFANEYAGRKIEFDATVLDVQRHGDANTRFDFLLMAGDGSRGPYFKFEDKNAVNDLHWKGSVPDSVAAGTTLHCIAEVERYNETQQLLFLDPVETSVR